MKAVVLFTFCVATASGQQWLKFYNHCEFDIDMLVYDESRHPQNHTLRGRDVYCEDCDVGAWDYRFGSFVLVVATKPTFTHYGLYAGQFDFPVQVRPVWNDSRRISGKKIKCDHANCEDASWKWTDLTEKTHTTKGEQMEITFCYDMYMEFLQCPAEPTEKPRD